MKNPFEIKISFWLEGALTKPNVSQCATHCFQAILQGSLTHISTEKKKAKQKPTKNPSCIKLVICREKQHCINALCTYGIINISYRVVVNIHTFYNNTVFYYPAFTLQILAMWRFTLIWSVLIYKKSSHLNDYLFYFAKSTILGTNPVIRLDSRTVTWCRDSKLLMRARYKHG